MTNLGGRRYTESELRSAGFKSVGKNVQISNRASIYGVENISIGDNVRIDDFATLIATNSLEIGSYVSIHNYCFLAARSGIYLMDFTTLAPSSKIFSASDDYHGNHLTGMMVPEHMTGGISGPVIVGKHSIIGANSIIMPNLTLREGTSVGANSMVKSNTDAWSIYQGTPAIKQGHRSRNLLGFELEIFKG